MQLCRACDPVSILRQNAAMRYGCCEPAGARASPLVGMFCAGRANETTRLFRRGELRVAIHPLRECLRNGDDDFSDLLVRRHVLVCLAELVEREGVGDHGSKAAIFEPLRDVVEGLAEKLWRFR